MNYITPVYSHGSDDNQALSCEEPVETLDLDYAISPVRECVAFQRRLDTRLTYSQLRAHICLDYELGCVDAQTTLERLRVNNLLGNPDQFVAIIAVST